MATKTLKTVPKISVKIWRPILDKLEAKIESACLRRDAYLAKVLEVELDWLDQEVSIPNSQASYDYVLERLDRLDRKLVSLALPQELTARLNDICSRKRIVRDAFRRVGIQHGRGHALRHTVACRIVNQGGSIKEVADVLRHRSLNTSMIYAKVDHGALSGVALPWPGSAA